MIVYLIIITGIIVLLLTFSITLIYLYQKRKFTYQQKINALQIDHERNLLKTQIEIQEGTFQEISREIHDNITLSLTYAKLNLNIVEWENTPKAKKQVEGAIEQITSSITDLSDISKSLNSELISHQGLIKALEKEVDKIRQTKLFIFDFTVTGITAFIESRKELVIFRIIQEALNNILKHSKAKWVALKMHYYPDQLEITIYDDEVGFDHTSVSENAIKDYKAGLNNMQKRAAIFNGNTLHK